MTRVIQQIVDDFGTHFDLVRRLLEMLNLADHMSDLRMQGKEEEGREENDREVRSLVMRGCA